MRVVVGGGQFGKGNLEDGGSISSSIIRQSPLLVLPHPVRFLDSKSILEDDPSFFQTQSTRFGIQRDDEDGTEETQPCVEPECSRCSDCVDEGEEGRSDNEVTSPVTGRR